MLLLSLAALLSSCATEGNDKKQDFIVKTTQAVPVLHQGEKEFSFIAQPFRTSELSFRVGGPIDRFDVYAGNRYKQGSIIAEIDPRVSAFVKNVPKQSTIRQKQSLNVYKSYMIKETSPQVLTKKQKQTIPLPKQLSIPLHTNWKIHALFAPFNGYVGEVYIEKFQDVKATQPVISFIDIDQLKLEIYVTQDIAYTAQAMDTIQVRFDAQPDKVYKAQIAEISKGTTRNNLSYLLTALLPNKEGKLLAGMSGKAKLNHPSKTPDITNGVAIPQTALCHRPTEGDYLWVVDANTQQVNLRKVKKEIYYRTDM